MGAVGGSRHYDGGGLGDERGWKCPGCGAVNLGLIKYGCDACGAGAPGHKGEPPPAPPRLDPEVEQVEQGDVADYWARTHPEASVAEAYRQGYAEGVRAARQAEPAPPQTPATPVGPDATIARTVVAALELFRDQILVGNPEEVQSGEWLSADQVTAFIQQILQTEAAHV